MGLIPFNLIGKIIIFTPLHSNTMLRKSILLLSVVLLQLLPVKGQGVNNKLKDVIYLKNKEVVSGTIIKDELGVLTIKVIDETTKNETVQTFQKFEVEKVIRGSAPASGSNESADNKEYNSNKQNLSLQNSVNSQAQPDLNPLTDSYSDLLNNENLHQNLKNDRVSVPEMSVPTPVQSGMRSQEDTGDLTFWTPPRPKHRRREWNRDISGYRGFIDYGYTHGVGNVKNNRFEIISSHGYQFNPIFFLGLGVGYNLSLNKKESSLPLFINPRINFLDEGTTPFWDVKGGYSFFGGRGYYVSSSFGVSFSKNDKVAFNIGLGYTLQCAKFDERSTIDPSKFVTLDEKYNGISLKLTFEY